MKSNKQSCCMCNIHFNKITTFSGGEIVYILMYVCTHSQPSVVEKLFIFMKSCHDFMKSAVQSTLTYDVIYMHNL